MITHINDALFFAKSHVINITPQNTYMLALPDTTFKYRGIDNKRAQATATREENLFICEPILYIRKKEIIIII